MYLFVFKEKGLMNKNSGDFLQTFKHLLIMSRKWRLLLYTSGGANIITTPCSNA